MGGDCNTWRGTRATAGYRATRYARKSIFIIILLGGALDPSSSARSLQTIKGQSNPTIRVPSAMFHSLWGRQTVGGRPHRGRPWFETFPRRVLDHPPLRDEP